MTSAKPLSRDDHLRLLQARQRGVFTYPQALQLGWTPAQVRTQARRGVWLSCGSGAYCLAEGVTPAAFELRRAAARMLAVGGDVVASHATVAVVLGMPFVPAPAVPVLTRHRTGPPVHLRGLLSAAVPLEHRMTVGGVPLTTGARGLVDVARNARDLGEVQALVDGWLRNGVRAADVEEVLTFCAGWPGTALVRMALAFSEPRCESPLESRARWWFHAAGLPAPEPQFLIAPWRVDFCWPAQRVVVECDGRVKYDDPWPKGDVVWAEKRREDGLREQGYTVLRAVWADGRDGGRAFCRRLAAALL